MKKSLIIMIVMMAAIAFAVPAFAVAPICNISSVVTTTAIGGSTFNPSLGVSMTVSSDANGYTATSGHGTAATGAGYEFFIIYTNNGLMKKAWSSGTAPTSCTTGMSWPTPVTGPSTTLSGFTQ